MQGNIPDVYIYFWFVKVHHLEFWICEKIQMS